MVWEGGKHGIIFLGSLQKIEAQKTQRSDGLKDRERFEGSILGTQNHRETVRKDCGEMNLHSHQGRTELG